MVLQPEHDPNHIGGCVLEPTRLNEAVRELLQHSPLAISGYAGFRWKCCMYCDARSNDVPFPHRQACPWWELESAYRELEACDRE